MEDLLGLGKGSEKLIEVIANAVGAIYRPYGIRREAEAEAYKIRLVEGAKSEQKAEEIRVIAEAKKDEILILDSTTSTLEERVESRKRFNELRRQSNLDNVITGAFNHIGNEIASDPVDPDWMQALIGYAEEANSEQMQDLWSKVLAGETELPGSFSLRSLEILKKMSRKDAVLFQAACQIASRFNTSDSLMLIKSFEVSNITGATKEEISLQKLGVGVTERMTLTDIGLLHNDIITSSKFRHEGFDMTVAGNLVRVVPKSDKAKWTCYHFTQTGIELAKLIPATSDTDYFNEFKEKSQKAFSVNCLEN